MLSQSSCFELNASRLEARPSGGSRATRNGSDAGVALGDLSIYLGVPVQAPVNTIINAAQLIKKGYDDASLPDDIIQEGMRIAVIVRDLLPVALEADPHPCGQPQGAGAA